jgi:3-deoxy-7-phosphoheptulonate synthase
MIIHLKENTEQSVAEKIAGELEAIVLNENNRIVLITPSALKKLDEKYSTNVEEYFVMDTDIQLANIKYKKEKREIKWGKTIIGGTSNHAVVIAGPCSIESMEQITQTAEMLVSLGIGTLRAGCYKPRTSPYSFQGLGLEGLKMLSTIREKYGLNIITEVRDSSHVADVIEYADIIQIGAKAMYDHGILKACAKTQKPILLKRGFGSTLQEFVQSAEFILSGGNPNVILCERGIRTFETKTRFTLDLCGAVYLKYHTNLPIILDPSHAIGYAYGVPDLSKACLAMGVDGLLIETHPNPKVAKSDASQQLDHPTFTKLHGELKGIASAINQKII